MHCRYTSRSAEPYARLGEVGKHPACSGEASSSLCTNNQSTRIIRLTAQYMYYNSKTCNLGCILTLYVQTCSANVAKFVTASESDSLPENSTTRSTCLACDPQKSSFLLLESAICAFLCQLIVRANRNGSFGCNVETLRLQRHLVNFDGPAARTPPIPRSHEMLCQSKSVLHVHGPFCC
jgi:hypothetical protein